MIRSTTKPTNSRALCAALCSTVLPLSGVTAAPDAIPAASLSIGQVQQDLAAHAYSVTALVQHYQQRIATLDVQGPALHAVLELNPDAPQIARQLDAHAVRGPLFGIPVLLKDNIDTADRMHTTAGSLALMDSRPPQDAFLVRRLRAAGAVILGKTNLSEWANFRSQHSISGWSARGGQTHNPYDVDRNPCGSSSGSGAAIAADFAVVAVGSETDGSIVCPSSVNGLVGIKPTVGLVSRSGIIPISVSQDTAGPMARTVSDAAILLGVLAGYDPDDPATLPLKDQAPPDYRAALRADSLRGARIGVLRDFAGFHEQVDRNFEEALAKLRALGAVLIDPVSIPTRGQFDDEELTVLQYEFKDGINHYLSTRRGTGPRDLSALIAFNSTHALKEMPWFGQDLLLASQRRGSLTDAAYIDARDKARRLAGAEGIDATLTKDHLDALVAPTMGPSWLTDPIDGDHFVGGGISSPSAVAGYPHITVPMKPVRGLPVGLSFVGAAWSEATLIGYAYAFEQATHYRVDPKLAVSQRGLKPQVDRAP
jgi:amidase